MNFQALFQHDEPKVGRSCPMHGDIGITGCRLWKVVYRMRAGRSHGVVQPDKNRGL